MAFNDAQVLDAETKAAEQMRRFNGEPLIAPDANAPLDPYAPQPEISRTPIDPYSPEKLAVAEAAKFGAVLEAPIAQADPGSVAPQGAAQPAKPVTPTGVTPAAETAATAQPAAAAGAPGPGGLPTQNETLSNPENFTSAGISYISEGAKDARRGDQHEAQALKDTDNDGVIDAAEEAAAVSGIMDDWKMEDAKIMADVGGKLQKNLEALQKQQEDIQMRYDQTFEEVANTYINPAELWDKGGAGAKIGMAGGAFLDTWFAMKGWNVPSFSATWDKAVEGNVKAQVSKLEQGNKKLAGFDRVWQMAGTMARNREDQIDITKDLLKANALGQYLARMKPYNSLQAIRDKEMAAAKIARETGKTKQERGEKLMEVGMKLRDQQIKEAELTIKQQMADLAAKKAKQAAVAGSGRGASKAAAGNASASIAHMRKWDANKLTDTEVDTHIANFKGAMPGDQDAIMSNLLSGGDKKAKWRPIYAIQNGVKRVVGYYDNASEGDSVKKEHIAKLEQYTRIGAKLTKINNLAIEAMAEVARDGGNPADFSTTAALSKWWGDKAKQDPKEYLSKYPAMFAFQQATSMEALKELHDLSGGAVTDNEAKRFEQFMPTGGFTRDGRMTTRMTSAMSILGDRSREEVAAIGTATGSVYRTQGVPTDVNSQEYQEFMKLSPAKRAVARLAAATETEDFQTTDIDLAKAIAEGLDAPKIGAKASDSPLGPNSNRDLNKGRMAILDSIKKEYLKSGVTQIPATRLSPDQKLRLKKADAIGAAGVAEVNEAFSDNRKDYWAGVTNTVNVSVDDAESLIKGMPADQQAGLASAIAELKALRKEAAKLDKTYRKDVEATESEDALTERNEFAERYRKVLDRIWAKGGAGLRGSGNTKTRSTGGIGGILHGASTGAKSADVTAETEDDLSWLDLGDPEFPSLTELKKKPKLPNPGLDLLNSRLKDR